MQPQISILALGLFAGLSSAQYVIDPNSVPIATRDAWCNSQITECPLICLQYANSTGAEVNTCDPKALAYECLCSNGITPNSSEYSQTLPYYVCTEWGTQCVAGCGQDNTCSSECRTDHPCGAQDPKRVNLTTTSASATGASSTAGSASTQTFGTFGSSASSSSSSSAASATYSHVGDRFGFLVVAAGLVGGLAFLL